MRRCPRCGKQAARRSPRTGFWEHAVSAVYRYPFRCQLCATRFSAWHVPRGGRQPNHREYDRLTVRVPVALSTATGQADGETIDLSLTGCSVRTEAPFTAGTTVQARLRLGQVGDVQVDAALVRSHGEGSLGLHFEQMSRSDRERLSRYLGRFLRPSGRPRARSGVPRPEILLAAALGIVLIFMVLMLIGRVGGPPLH